MGKVPIINKQERDDIRARLQQYQKAHGKMGVPKLYECMLFSLDTPDHYYLDLKSLQRFLTEANWTSDEKVVRYRKFLERESPADERAEFVPDIGRALLGRRLTPETVAPWIEEEKDGITVMVAGKPVPFDEHYWRRPLTDYLGRYDLQFRKVEDERSAKDQGGARRRHCLLLPTTDAAILKAIRLSPIFPESEDVGAALYQADMHDALFMKTGFGQFILISAGGLHLDVTIFDETGADTEGAPITLTGNTVHTAAPENDSTGLAQMILTQIAGPNLKNSDP